MTYVKKDSSGRSYITVKATGKKVTVKIPPKTAPRKPGQKYV